MILKIKCSLPQFSIMDESIASAIVGTKLKVYGFPATILECSLDNSGTMLDLELEIDSAHRLYFDAMRQYLPEPEKPIDFFSISSSPRSVHGKKKKKKRST